MSFTAVLKADIKNFESNVEQAGRKMDGLQKDVEKSSKSMSEGFKNFGKNMTKVTAAVTAAAAGVVYFVKKAGDMANNMGAVAAAVDATTDTLQEFAHVAIKAGTDTDTFERATEALIRRLKDIEGEGSGAPETIRKLGVALHDANGNMRRAGDISQDVITSLAGMENASERNVIASQLFGRQWAKLAPILNLGADGVKALREEAHGLGLVLSEAELSSLNDFSVAMNVLKERADALKNKFAAELAPFLMDKFIPFVEDRLIPAFMQFIETIKNIVKSTDDFRGKFKETFEKIRDLVTGIWEKFGDQLTSIWQTTFLQIRTVIDTFVKIIGNVADILNGIFTGNWKLALSGLSDLFTNIFQGIYNIVMGAIARMASGISGFLKFVGLEKLSTSLQNFSQNLNERIAENIAVSEKQKETVEATEKATKKLTDTTNELTVATQTGTQAIVERVAAMEALTGKTFEGTIATEIDAGLEIDDLERRISERLEALKEKAAEFTLDVGGMIQDSVTSLMEGIGVAIGDGTSVIDAIGAALLGTLGGLAVQIGQQMIAFGTAGVALQKLTLNPLLALAAGAALVALGSAAKSAVSRSMSSAGAGGYSGGTSGTYSDRQSLGASTLRGAYQDDFLVEFKIGNDALVGTLNTAEQRKNRTI